ncbi:NADPH-dependent oxidoreductase [Candidatus Dojkabacteria bacterium]|nr:NADPH-dependent oxidoreductase [Candidatus Dojkabacteria bacterium]
MNQSKMIVPILLGTARTDRESEKVAEYVKERMLEYGFETQIVDARDHMLDRTIPNWQDAEPSKEWAEIMTEADGLMIVAPEYNHGFPGEFKIVFDQLFKEYKKKPVSICSVSSGGFGGTRMIEQIWSVVLAAQMVPTSFAVHFSNVKDLFDGDGEMLDEERDSFDKRVKKMLEETDWYAKALKAAREKGEEKEV